MFQKKKKQESVLYICIVSVEKSVKKNHGRQRVLKQNLTVRLSTTCQPQSGENIQSTHIIRMRSLDTMNLFQWFWVTSQNFDLAVAVKELQNLWYLWVQWLSDPIQ